MINQIIRSAINKIGEFYPDGMQAWLAEKNPIALTHLWQLQDKVDAYAIANDEDGTRRACNLWVTNWEFWVKKFVVETHFKKSV